MKNKTYYLILLIITIAVNIIFFSIPSTYNLSFFISYTLTMITLISQIFIIKYLEKNNHKKNNFIGISFIYWNISLIITLIIITLITKFINDFPTWLSIIINTLIITINIIRLILLNNSVNYINNINDKTKNKVNNIKNMKIEIDLLIEKENNQTIKKELIKLSDKIKYSDPYSSNELKGIEENIINKIEQLKSSKEKEVLVSEITLLLEERNKKCKIYK